jgi:hypothetical protein
LIEHSNRDFSGRNPGNRVLRGQVNQGCISAHAKMHRGGGAFVRLPD